MKATSPLLIDESPLQVLPSLATKIGLHEAIIVQQIHYWIRQPKSYRHSDRSWVYNTYQEWREQFPFMSPISIKRAMIKLEKQGLIHTAQFDLAKGDAKKYYTIDYNALNELYADSPPDQNDLTHEIKMIPPSDQIDTTMGSKRSHLIRTETTTETTTENISFAPKTARPSSKSKRSSSADPRTSHPAIQACRSVARANPRIELYDSLIALLGESPDIERMQKCRGEWLMRGYNPASWKWLTEWYGATIPEQGGNHGRTNGTIEPTRKTADFGIRDAAYVI